MTKEAVNSVGARSMRGAPAEFVQTGAPIIPEERVDACPVCGSALFTSYAEGFDYELLTCANEWRFVVCTACSHVWLNPRPALSELGTIYPQHYYAYDFETKVNPLALRGKAFLDYLKMRPIFGSFKKEIRSFLDIGCGSGRFLQLAADRGVSKNQIYGLELDSTVVEKLKQRGFQAFAERVESCSSIPPRSIDLATMFHVIEHVDDPLATVKKIREWLSTDGMLVLETPNLESVDARLFRRTYWGGYHIPRHWNLFTPRSITELLRRAGYRVEGISFQTGHSFWMYSCHHSLRYGTLQSPRLASLFDPLKGLPFLIFFTGLDKLRATFGFKTSAMLITARPA